MTFVLNVLISSLTIGLAAWLSRRSAALAGFIIAMPLATMLVLPMAHLQHGELETSLRLARSIFLAIPVSLAFFVPFLLSQRLGLSFWEAYGCACLLLPLGYVAHRFVTGAL